MPAHPLASSGSLWAVLILVLVLSVWYDVSEQRIPNWLTVGGLVSALVLRGIIGPGALGVGLLGGALGFFLGILLFAAGAMGAGDGKLLTAVGSFLGFETFLRSLPLIGIFGGLLALIVTVRKGALMPTLRRFGRLLVFFMSFGWIGIRRTLSTPGAVTVPYGVAVAAGAAMACLAWGFSF